MLKLDLYKLKSSGCIGKSQKADFITLSSNRASRPQQWATWVALPSLTYDTAGKEGSMKSQNHDFTMIRLTMAALWNKTGNRLYRGGVGIEWA